MDNEWEDGVEQLMSELGALIKKNHVLNSPKSNTLKLGKPSTQGGNWNFTRAEIMGQKAGLEKIEGDWMVTLPAGINWDPDDTIITLQ